MTRRLLPAALPLAVAAFAVAADPFANPPDTEKGNARPMPPAEAAAGFQVPAGFKVSVFAAEPDVRNPIALAWDGRGRLWMAENYTFAEREKKFDLDLRDRVLIFTDADGDGKPEKRTVFLDTVQRLTSVEVGRGGVWLMCPPQLLFVPDKDGDDNPDGPPQVVLEGFEVPAENHHNFANGLRWGPDGWLYGRCGASAPGKVRRPDQSPDAAIPLAGGVWRYHPITRVFEPLSHGTTNPWGHDWDEHGEGFFVNSVNGHLWHLIPGAHYRRPHTLSPNPLVYEPMEMHADHWHFDTGKDWTASRNAAGKSDELGGGHAHSGAMIYLGDQWPKEYRGRLLTLNLHGRRANVERLERAGSGYVGKREPDTLKAADPFFRGIDLTYGPDGSVYVVDWSDTGECHEHTGVHRNSGRIYRVMFGDPKPTPAPDMTKMTNAELVAAHQHPNAWYSRQARVELLARQDAGQPVPEYADLFNASVDPPGGRPAQYRLAQTMFALRAVPEEVMPFYRTVRHPRLLPLTVRYDADRWPLDTVTGVPRAEEVAVPEGVLNYYVKEAADGSDGLVRLSVASALQRLPVKHRPRVAAALLSRADDAADPNLPFLVWYGLIPVAHKDPVALAKLAADGKFPKVREWAARRFAESLAADPTPLQELLARTADKLDADRRDVLTGITAGLAGVRKATPPPAWKTYPKTIPGEESAVRALEVVFGDGRALDEVRRLALDGKADLAARKAALAALIDADPADLRAVCEPLLKTRFLNTVALRGLTKSDDPAVGRLIAGSYRSFHQSERGVVIDALASRPAFAAVLLEQVAAGAIPRGDLSAVHARQIRGFANPELTKKLTAVWGEFRDSPKDKADLIARLKADLTPDRIKSADPTRGRAVFAQACANCHRLYDAGGEIGPNLTGAGRKDLDYLLSNVVDPSAVVTKDFQMTLLTLNDGRVVSGIVVSETPAAVTVQTDKARLAVPKEDIEKRTASPLSLMPDGLLQPLSPEQVRDLIAYLMSDGQVPLPAMKE